MFLIFDLIEFSAAILEKDHLSPQTSQTLYTHLTSVPYIMQSLFQIAHCIQISAALSKLRLH